LMMPTDGRTALEDQLDVVIGVDAHKRTHTLVACDQLGRQAGVKTVEATTDGHLAALEWAARWPRRRSAVEDCRHLTRRLEADLLRAGETLARVPPKMMADTRRSAREYGKSDPIDALAVARAAWREPNLPTAVLDGPHRELRLLVDHREDLVRERTRVQARVLWHLLEIDPAFQVRPRGLRSQRGVRQVDAPSLTATGLWCGSRASCSPASGNSTSARSSSNARSPTSRTGSRRPCFKYLAVVR